MARPLCHRVRLLSEAISRPASCHGTIRVFAHSPRLRSSSTIATHPSTHPLPSSPPPKRRRTFRRVSYTIFLLLGLATGYTVKAALFPPKLPDPYTEVDDELVARLAQDVDNLPIVQQLRLQVTGSQIPRVQVGSLHNDIRTQVVEEKLDEGVSPMELEGGWIEVSTMKPHTRTLTTKSLAGFRGLGVQRAFWRPATGELVVVLWLGGGLMGWPGLAHGGAIGTLLVEEMGKVVGCLGSGQMEGVAPSEDSVPEPSSLTLVYKRPTHVSAFYVLRAQLNPSASSTDETKVRKLPGASEQLLANKIAVDGTLETLEGKVCVQANAVWDFETLYDEKRIKMEDEINRSLKGGERWTKP